MQNDLSLLTGFEVEVVVVWLEAFGVDGNRVRKPIRADGHHVAIGDGLGSSREAKRSIESGRQPAGEAMRGGKNRPGRAIAKRRRHHIVAGRSETVRVGEVEEALEQRVRVDGARAPSGNPDSR